MRIGVPREPADQPRVAASPQTVERMIRMGYEVLVERGAGTRAQFPDDAYEPPGAQSASGVRIWGCEVVVSASAPTEEHLALMSRGAVLICRLDPARRPDLLEQLRERGITCLALDVVPRISRAQSLDVLSSQANLAGYRAVDRGGLPPGQAVQRAGDRRGKFPPATVYVIGAGWPGCLRSGRPTPWARRYAAPMYAPRSPIRSGPWERSSCRCPAPRRCPPTATPRR